MEDAWQRMRQYTVRVSHDLLSLTYFLSSSVCLLIAFAIFISRCLTHTHSPHLFNWCRKTHTHTFSILFLCQPLSSFQSPLAWESLHTPWPGSWLASSANQGVSHELSSVPNNSPKKHSMIKTHTDIKRGANQPGRSLCLWVMSADKIRGGAKSAPWHISSSYQHSLCLPNSVRGIRSEEGRERAEWRRDQAGSFRDYIGLS